MNPSSPFPTPQTAPTSASVHDLRLFVSVVDAIRSNTWKASTTLSDLRYFLEGENPSGAVTDEFLRAACEVAGVTFDQPPADMPVPVIPDISVLRAMEDLVAEQRNIVTEIRALAATLVEHRKLVREERDMNRRFMLELNNKMDIYRPVKSTSTDPA